jgi:hypothetical protein
MSIITSIGTILDDTERRRCDIYIDQCKHVVCNCDTCGELSPPNWYVRACSWSSNIAEVHYTHNVLCIGCIAELYHCRSIQLEHIFEMYKAIRCIHTDVAKYMLKFVYIPSITDMDQR